MRAFALLLASVWLLLNQCDCTTQERALALSADQAACAVLQAVDKKDAPTIAAVCAVELPIASAVVQAVGDAGARP